jgi:ATP-dependent Lon protease
MNKFDNLLSYAVYSLRFNEMVKVAKYALENSKTAFSEITDSLESLGIIFTYEFVEKIHDRSIEMDNGWKIVFGRGLNMFQKANGWNDIAGYYQEKRFCKACEITYVKI